ncbi:hypothetical protein HMI51_17680 [Corallococcus coralloides]|nr:hypothetical protein [Corallococcus coralloides]
MSIRTLLFSALLLVTACGPEEVAPVEEPSSGDGRVEALGACYVNLDCNNGTSISCSSAGGDCHSTATTVTCDGVTQTCGSCAPEAKTIVETITACYPAHHPYGRFLILGAESGVTYTWSGYSTNLHWTTGISAWVSATSVGWFTLTVTATRPGCDISTTFSADFYAEDESNTGACG